MLRTAKTALNLTLKLVNKVEATLATTSDMKKDKQWVPVIKDGQAAVTFEVKEVKDEPEQG